MPGHGSGTKCFRFLGSSADNKQNGNAANVELDILMAWDGWKNVPLADTFLRNRIDWAVLSNASVQRAARAELSEHTGVSGGSAGTEG
jgi:hypothetical protein